MDQPKNEQQQNMIFILTQLTNIISDSDKLIKLKMSNMFLRDEQLIKNLCYVIQSNKNLIALDISWAQLRSKQLNQIVFTLSRFGKSMRNLNLSYNYLDFNEKSPEYNDSISFMNNFKAFLQYAIFINHINFSGMCF